jgi:GntR family transcriptional regulator of abcA and norABC
MKSKDVVNVDWKPDKGSKEPAYKQIENYICNKISKGDWVIGSRLPSQRSLAEIFGVNRSTVVMALDNLISYGMLESKIGRETKVASNTWSVLMSSTALDWNFYISSGSFKENIATIQTINRLEFVKTMKRLGTGELSPKLYPFETMKKVLNKLADTMAPLGYVEPLGLYELRESLSKRLKKIGIQAEPSNILITSGSLQGLQLISVGILDTDSVVCTEAPSYLKSLQVFQSAGIKFSGIPMDKEGLKYWNLVRENQTYKDLLLYTIPTHQNPTGCIMSLKRRTELFNYCTNARIPIIEDDAYGELWFDEEPPKSIKSMDKNGLVIYLGTVSKTMAPGLRIGWLVGPESVVKRLGDIKMQTDYGSSSVSQWIVRELLEEGMYDEYIVWLRVQLKRRRDIMLNALEKHMKNFAKWEVPTGGFYIWIELIPHVSMDKLFFNMLKQNVLFNPGNIYDFKKNNSIRLSYSYMDEEDMDGAIKQLAKEIESHLRG